MLKCIVYLVYHRHVKVTHRVHHTHTHARTNARAHIHTPTHLDTNICMIVATFYLHD